MKTGIPKRFLSLRDKSGHRRGKLSDPSNKHRSQNSEAFFSIFKRDSTEPSRSEEADKEKEKLKVEEVIKQLAVLEINNAAEDHVLYALNTKYAAWDVHKAIELMILQRKSLTGKILHYNPNVPMLGAENRGNVTCYLDALLFAMFAKLEAFECMLKADLPDEPQRRLAALLRLWVNMLRSGKLIEADMTKHIQDALAACGWADAQLLEQQDTSEAFAFITETLRLPLLTLQVDLFHQGKNDEADHKVVYERLLNLAVPPDTDGKGVNLEDCLEEYFNAQVDVHRDSLDEKGARRLTLTTPIARSGGFNTPVSPAGPATPIVTQPTDKSTIRIITDEDKGSLSPMAAHHETIDDGALERRWSENAPSSPQAELTPVSPTRPHRSRTESIIQRVILDDDGKASPSTEETTATVFERARQRKVSVVKAITIPAWQFFRLIPWHSPASKEPQSDLEVARHFSQRPVVGICLKRYTMTEGGVPIRQNTYIDIPDSMRLPHFILDDRQVEENGLSTEYKLILQSVVCHRGESLHSGHYISFARVAPKLLTDNRRHESDPPPDYEEAQWVKFDDLSYESRITPVDDFKQALKEEMPYLLFYQVVPIVDVTASSTDGDGVTELPSYDDAAVNVTVSDTSATSGNTQEAPVISRQASSYFENVSTLPSTNASIRFSSELERPSRRSMGDEDGYLSVSRRGSADYSNYSIGTGPSPGHTPLENRSPGATPGATPAEETTAQRLSRAAARFKSSGSKSRPQSQSGEGRISLTMSRLSGRLRTSKDASRENISLDYDELPQVVQVDGVEDEKETDKEKARESHLKRGRSKRRPDKGKGREPGGAKAGDVPDRECIVQ